jgi:hypothetical protein
LRRKKPLPWPLPTTWRGEKWREIGGICEGSRRKISDFCPSTKK